VSIIGGCGEMKPKKTMRCDRFTNHNTDKNGKCIRFWTCSIQGWTKDEKCPARGQK